MLYLKCYHEKVKMRKKPWITKQLLTKIREKNKTYEKYLKSKYIFWCNRYINSRNAVKRLIEKKQKELLQKLFTRKFFTIKKHLA